MSEQFVIVGLGNPGSRYAGTRHNAGFMLVDKMAGTLGAGPWKAWENSGQYARAELAGREICLFKPLTYMNNSGEAVGSYVRFKKIPPRNVLVCFDDLSLPCGKIRIRKTGSAGGQNGMKSIIAHLGTQDIARLRMGIGPQPSFMDAADFVLSTFRPDEKPLFETGLAAAHDALGLLLEKGLDAAMNKFNAG